MNVCVCTQTDRRQVSLKPSVASDTSVFVVRITLTILVVTDLAPELRTCDTWSQSRGGVCRICTNMYNTYTQMHTHIRLSCVQGGPSDTLQGGWGGRGGQICIFDIYVCVVYVDLHIPHTHAHIQNTRSHTHTYTYIHNIHLVLGPFNLRSIRDPP